MTSNSADPQHIQTFWRLKGPSGHIIACAAYQGSKAHPIELRIGYGFDRPIMVEHAANLVVARQRAAQLLETLRDQEGFEVLN